MAKKEFSWEKVYNRAHCSGSAHDQSNESGCLKRFIYSFNKFHELKEEFIEDEDASDLEQSPNGKIYTCKYGLGSCSLHFWINGANYISYEINIQNWKTDDKVRLPKKMFFQDPVYS